MDLVTLQQARDHLRSDSEDDDADLQLKIAAASSAVLSYITASVWEPERDDEGRPVIGADGKETPLLDVDGNRVVRTAVQQATLLAVGYFYRERDGSQEHHLDGQFGYGYALPRGALALLYHLRQPTAV